MFLGTALQKRRVQTQRCQFLRLLTCVVTLSVITSLAISNTTFKLTFLVWALTLMDRQTEIGSDKENPVLVLEVLRGLHLNKFGSRLCCYPVDVKAVHIEDEWADEETHSKHKCCCRGNNHSNCLMAQIQCFLHCSEQAFWFNFTGERKPQAKPTMNMVCARGICSCYMEA